MEELFKKFIKQECSQEEVEQIIDYLKSNNTSIEIPTIESMKDLLSKYPDMENTQSNEIYKNIINTKEKEKKKFTERIRIWKYAAAIVIIGVFTSIYFFNSKLTENLSHTNSETVVNENLNTGTHKAVLTIEGGESIVLKKGKKYKIKNLKSTGEKLVYKPMENVKVDYNTLTVPRGGEFKLVLSDGTKVWLNSETQIIYPSSFKKGELRQVELVYGEAYFNVSHSSNHNGAKFKVINKSQEIMVLGTKFNIKAYRDEPELYTTLVGGKVTVNNSLEKVELTPNQQSVLNVLNKNIIVNKVDAKSEIAWVHGDFVFHQKPLKEITKVLSRWYDIDFVIENKELEDVRFNGELSKYQSLEEILILIESSKFINQYEIYEKKIILK